MSTTLQTTPPTDRTVSPAGTIRLPRWMADQLAERERWAERDAVRTSRNAYLRCDEADLVDLAGWCENQLDKAWNSGEYDLPERPKWVEEVLVAAADADEALAELRQLPPLEPKLPARDDHLVTVAELDGWLAECQQIADADVMILGEGTDSWRAAVGTAVQRCCEAPIRTTGVEPGCSFHDSAVPYRWWLEVPLERRDLPGNRAEAFVVVPAAAWFAAAAGAGRAKGLIRDGDNATEQGHRMIFDAAEQIGDPDPAGWSHPMDSRTAPCTELWSPALTVEDTPGQLSASYWAPPAAVEASAAQTGPRSPNEAFWGAERVTAGSATGIVPAELVIAVVGADTLSAQPEIDADTLQRLWNERVGRVPSWVRDRFVAAAVREGIEAGLETPGRSHLELVG